MKRFIFIVGIISALALPVSLYSQTLHISHCVKGCPTGTDSNNEVIVHHLFAVSINQQTRLADWLSYRIIPGSLGVASLLSREWQDDELMRGGVVLSDLDTNPATNRTSPSGRQDSVYSIGDVNIVASDRGRLVPLTSFAGSSYWRELNFLSVMSPIKFDMRVGPWARLEQAINDFVREAGEVFVLVGPLFAQSDEIGGEESNRGDMPSAYFKVIASPAGAVTAFVFEQNLAQHKNYCDQIVDIESVESRTGLKLFPQTDAWPVGSLDRQLNC